jgi:hypothetical protein
MALQLKISYDDLLELVKQLSKEQQLELLQYLQHEILTREQKLKILQSAQIHVDVRQDPSDRREDWYDDDGR